MVGLALALSSAIATAGDVGVISTGEPNEACIAAGTAVPRILDGGPWLNHPGDRKTQFFAAEADYRPLPEECAAAFNRKAEIRFQVQIPEKHSRWIDANGYEIPVKPRQVQKEELEQLEQEREAQGKSCWKPIPGGEESICRIDIHVGNDGGVAEVFFSPPRRLHEPSYARHDPRIYGCTSGKGVTHVRALFRNTVTNSGTGKVVAQQIATVPVRVRSYPGKGPMPQAWRGAVRGPC